MPEPNSQFSTVNSQLPCPKCHSREFKPWPDLTRDEQIAAEAQPNSTKFTHTQRKKHRICTRCWFEQPDRTSELA